MRREKQNLDDVMALGKTLGRYIQPGTIAVLTGDLGAGKTQFARSVARGLGVEGSITSPTFAILKTYPEGRIPLNHMDLYRLEEAAQLDDLDFWDLLQDGEPSATLIEWGEIFDSVVAASDLIVKIELFSDTLRTIELEARTERAEKLLDALKGQDNRR